MADAAKIVMKQGDAPSAPAADKLALYPKTDGLFYFKDEDGNEYQLPARSMRSLADDEVVTVATAKNGRVWAQITNAAYVEAVFDASGNIESKGDTKSGAVADSDGYLCVYADGTAIKVKNRTGATATVGWCVVTW